MRAYLELLRLPTVFTAMADILLGFLLVHGQFEPLPSFVGLLVASCCLYLSGMVFNDLFDVQQDLQERPQRPIPSGRVSRRTAALLGSGLMVLGVIAAGTVGVISLGVAVGLVIAVLAYDAVLKRTPFGPVGMGTCRFLNLMLGASAYPLAEFATFWSPPPLTIALGLGIYIAGVTWFARTEAQISSRGALLGSLGVMDVGLVILGWHIVTQPKPGQPPFALMLLCLIGISINSRGLRAVSDPVPQRVQGLVKLYLLNYVTLSATMVYWHTGNGALTLLTAGLVIPAMLLSRLIAMT